MDSSIIIYNMYIVSVYLLAAAILRASATLISTLSPFLSCFHQGTISELYQGPQLELFPC